MIPSTRPKRLASLLVGLPALGLFGACGGESDVPQERSQRLIVICMDTLRADRLGLYGCDRPTSPQLERFAEGATVYTRAQAAAPWTLPSHASMFTGLHPFEHGARTWPVEELSALAERGWKANNNVGPLEDYHETLAEVLQAEGYATGAVVANIAYLHPNFGIAQGFDDYELRREPCEDINRAAFRWLEDHAEEPFFLFLNYMDTHRPYNTRPRDNFPDTSTYGDALAAVAPLVLNPDAEVPPDLLQACKDQYDLSIANLDEGLGALFDGLRERGLFEDSTIVITSDHGEFLGEKQLIEHSKDVYQGALHIPLLVKAPRQQAGAKDEDWIGHVHFPELILPHLQLASPGRAMDRLVRHPRSEPVLSENYFARMRELRSPWGQRFQRVRRTAVDGDWKYIESSDEQHELYDLATDPGEERSLLTEQPAQAERLRQSLMETLEGSPMAPLPGTPPVQGAELEQAMSDLGYAGSDEDENER